MIINKFQFQIQIYKLVESQNYVNKFYKIYYAMYIWCLSNRTQHINRINKNNVKYIIIIHVYQY